MRREHDRLFRTTSFARWIDAIETTSTVILTILLCARLLIGEGGMVPAPNSQGVGTIPDFFRLRATVDRAVVHGRRTTGYGKLFSVRRTTGRLPQRRHSIGYWTGIFRQFMCRNPAGNNPVRKLVAEYLERAHQFERMAAAESNPAVKAEFEKQAAAYQKLAAKRAKEMGMQLPADRPKSK